MSVKGGVYVHEAYEAKKSIFFCYVNTSHRHRFCTYICYSGAGGGRGKRERTGEKKTELKTTKLKQTYRTTMFTANGYLRSIRCLKTPPKACTSPIRSYLSLSLSILLARARSPFLPPPSLLSLSLSLSLCVRAKTSHSGDLEQPSLSSGVTRPSIIIRKH
jgi:hypothetical protein